MKITALLLTFTYISLFAAAEQKPELSFPKPVVTSVKDDLNWYDLQKQQSLILQGVGWNGMLNRELPYPPIQIKL